MTRPLRPQLRLAAALASSLALHLLPFMGELLPPPRPQRPPTLTAHLRALPPPATIPEDLRLETPPPSPPRAVASPPRPAGGRPEPAPRGWEAAVQKQLRQLDERGLLYPPEAIAQRLEGVVTVLFVLDEGGQVAAARVEQGSGHPVLDQAALRAVHTLRALPADAPREAVLPVRFRLR